MSIATALAFIRAVRADAALAESVRALGPDASLAEVAAIAGAAGHPCTPGDLREAHRRDWALRRLPQAVAEAAAENRASSARASAK